MKKQVLIIFVIAIGIIACNDSWNEHYAADQTVSSNYENVMELINDQADLSTFKQMIEFTGYDVFLRSNQSYTVWAPTNSAFSGPIDWTDSLSIAHTVTNHITRSSYPTSRVAREESRILMLARKFITFVRTGTNGWTFGNEALVEKDLAAKNGIVHKINNIIPFEDNLWQYLKQGETLDSICKYLYSFDVYAFDEYNSVFLGTNESGQRLYDSVFYYRNPLVQSDLRAQLAVEDSIYTMLIPNNDAWNKAYAKVKDLYRPYIRSTVTQAYRDSVQDSHTKRALVNDLIYRGSLENFSSHPADSLTSTSNNVFYAPARLFENASPKPLSNGIAYITDELKFGQIEAWQKPVVWEAENALGRTNTASSVYVRYATGSLISGISRDCYLLVNNISTLNPLVEFSIPNTLAGTYNIWCIFVPGNIENEREREKTKVQFRLTYLRENGTSVTERNIRPDDRETSETEMKAILVRENFKFPYANYNEEETTVKVTVETEVAANETAIYVRRMRIDCILLEPVEE